VSIPDATLHLSLAELSEQVRTRRLDPVELAEAYMDRLQRFGPDLGALVTVTRERGLAEARQARDEIAAGRWRGPLHGVPYGAKDLIGAEGYPTTWGAQPYREQRLPDAAVVERLKAAGAVLVAKLASVELAGGFGYEQADASFTGPGRTPWNRDYWSGGSSSGPGAAVAAALVPFAIGSETWGSIFAPAALSGVTGLRPTYGRVSRWGAMALSWTMDKIGPMCRTAEDCGLVLQAIAGPDPRDESAQPRPYRHAADAVMPRRPRLGVLKGNAEGSQAEVRRNFEASLEVLSRFADLVRDVELPEYPYGAAASMIIDAEAASIFEELVSSGRVRELSAPEDRIGGYAGQVVLAKDYLRAMRIRRPAGEALDRMFVEGGFDALVHPTWSTVSYPVGKPFDEAYTDLTGDGEGISGAANLVGLPGIALPNGFGRENLPTSIAFTGRAWTEGRLIAIAREVQRRTDWHRRIPPGY
jgi:aspartyl-tRNA(Asn)/glutamyl-tRNA(Gln) amidotransferase subunit A